ncbi:EF-hand calcium-binding domain-containing protein 1-like isoform X1 [Anopheles stephensi]|nr:EF-hand calcium-binding domain-containing protein 1-like isoform X1 [Anopheles stephensi]XP_035894999.1 EF-hand calcium-binding domain-containing protein 1-like isoform X1 [Anopheles stephensi]XP_035895008.1 EF-hand calcium-binding domain-containing protein 1-like isoform X1 [Anopheles stephensi]XP_035895020.1 EF-hand calcium-binding domain-containing protein 1-like isoform X1 [Anopheles stephensi]
MSRKQPKEGGGGAGGRSLAAAFTNNTKGGAMIMKSVSIFLASGRRASAQSRDQAGNGPNGSAHQPRADTHAKDQNAGTARTTISRDNRRILARMDELNGKLNPKMLEMYKRRTHFSKVEVEALCKIYRKLVANASMNSKALAASNPGVIAKAGSSMDGIDRSVFRELLHSTFDIVTEETLMERIFCAWEKGYEGLPIRLEGWLMGLSTFLKGSQAEKTAFCFRVYDLNSDGFITKDEMFALLRNCLIKQPQDEDPDEGVKDLVEIALRKLDMDKDGKISFQDYQEAIAEEPLLLEAFGQCLPSDRATMSFLSTLQAQEDSN